MTIQPADPPIDLESRLLALETSVARLISMVEPAFAASNIAAPVALPLLKEAAQHASSAKFFALLDIGEALLKYSAALAFASIIKAGNAQSEEIMEMFKQPPTLGKLAEALRKILDDQTHTEWPMDILRTAFRKPNDKPTPAARYLFDDFIKLRNDERGHGAQQPEGHYEGLYLRNHLILHDSVRNCKHVQIPLVYIHAVDHVREQYSYKTTILMGAVATRSPESIETPVKLRVGSACVWDHGVHLLPLQEFVIYSYCTTCALEHVFFAERITKERVFYHSYFGSHRLVVERAAK
jgi:hypothetical protein